MNRRLLLKWASSGLAAACAAFVVVPGVGFVLSALRRPARRQGVSCRVARLLDLPVGHPTQAAVSGRRRDAWTVHPDTTIGRVWLVRRSDDATPPEQAQVDVFTAVCPHLGCAIGLDAGGKKLVCPCHKAAFDLRGKKVMTDELGRKNHAPRDMDALRWHIVRDDESGEWWVEVQYEKFEPGLKHKKAVA
jgi:menaquinol-cytochrome c reductase iron-sulfur subunit